MGDALKYSPQSDVLTAAPSMYAGFNVSDANSIPYVLNSSALQPESCDEFSKSPFEFRESAEMLWEDTKLIYEHACSANRFTEDYLKLCGRLEKNIKQVGSLCITKAVLEQKGFLFPELAGMEVGELLGMVSYHLRKCHAAFRSIYRGSNFLGMSYLNWEFRWVELGNRLKSTDVKIRNILDGTVNIEKMLKRESDCSPAASDRNGGKDVTDSTASLSVNPLAMPINGSLVRTLIRQQAEVKKQEQKEQKMLDELYGIWEKKNDFSSSLKRFSGGMQRFGMGLPFNQSALSDKDRHQAMHEALSGMKAFFCYPKPGGQSELITAEEARKILIEDAESRGDKKTAEQISREDENRLQYRWVDFLEDPPDDG